jgi:hypothetical protein
VNVWDVKPPVWYVLGGTADLAIVAAGFGMTDPTRSPDRTYQCTAAELVEILADLGLTALTTDVPELQAAWDAAHEGVSDGAYR